MHWDQEMCSHHVLCAHSLQRVVSLSGLTTQHNAVIAVQHSVGNIAGLSAGRAGLLGHALQHLLKQKQSCKVCFCQHQTLSSAE